MPVVFEFDHIIPRSAGGDTIFDNLCLSCPTCNRHKATRLTAQDPVSKNEVPLFHPLKQTWTEHYFTAMTRLAVEIDLAHDVILSDHVVNTERYAQMAARSEPLYHSIAREGVDLWKAELHH